MRLLPELLSPEHRTALEAGGAELRCARGCSFPVRGGIPRFVASSGYASAFGPQWNSYRRTQLDSYTGTTISRALLDTFDALTDRYKHLRTPDEIARALHRAGLEVVECRRGGNGVEARAVAS